MTFRRLVEFAVCLGAFRLFGDAGIEAYRAGNLVDAGADAVLAAICFAGTVTILWQWRPWAPEKKTAHDKEPQ